MVSVSREGREGSGPRTFGRYRLASKIASGGMGSVYLASAHGPGGFEKLVALKRIHEHMAQDQRFVTMFLDEARIAARIQHPNVCTVIDFGEIDGSYYLTMPYIFGRALNRVVATAIPRRGDPVGSQLPLMGLRMVADACEGLHAAHELRDENGQPLEVVHRDVSPANLLVGYDGTVRVLDFGVASAKHRLYQTNTGEVKGKFAYCSPEQIEAKPVDRRSDIWSLGVVLWETVTGRRLFSRDTMIATVRAVADMPIADVTTIQNDIPAGVQRVIARALDRDPEKRYPTARAMGRDLLKVLAAEGSFLGAPDVADWMAGLFPEHRQEQEQAVELTRTSSVGQLISGVQPSPEPNDADTRIESTSMLVPVPPSQSGSTQFLASEKRATSGAAAAAIGAFVAVLLVAGIAAGAFVWMQPDEEPSVVLFGLDDPPAPAAVVAPDPARALESSAAERTQSAEADDSSRRDEAGPGAPSAPGAGAVIPEADVAPEPGAVIPDPVVEPEPVVEPVSEVEAAPVTRRRRPVRRRPPPAAPGRLNVNIRGGWALVFLGDRRLGEAPGVFAIPSGTQTVSIQPFGEGPRQRRRVVIRPGVTARLVYSIN